jgi:hypothetical protein
LISQKIAMSQEDTLPGTGKTLGLPGGVSVLVTRAPRHGGVLRCDGDVLAPQRPPACSARTGTGTILAGQRFTDPVSGLEIVCTRAGDGALTFAGRPLQPIFPADPPTSATAPDRQTDRSPARLRVPGVSPLQPRLR